MTLRNCYITGQPTANETYYGERIFLPVCEEAFAHFIIRTKSDHIHQDIFEREGKIRDQLREFQQGLLDEGWDVLVDERGYIIAIDEMDYDVYAEKALTQARLTTELSTVMTEKAASGLRILRAIKDDYQRTGKLSSDNPSKMRACDTEEDGG